jgi:hypothetical protein
MPNWCSNQLKVSGNKDSLFVFRLAAKSEEADLSLNSLIPCHRDLYDVSSGSYDVAYDLISGDLESLSGYNWIPEEHRSSCDKALDFLSTHFNNDMRAIGQKMKENVVKYGAKNWYEWCNKNWGVKWDVNGRLDAKENGLTYSFDSAWGPPSEAIRKISELFSGLTFELEYFESGMAFAGKMIFQGGDIIEDDYRSWTNKESLEEVRDCGDFVASEVDVLLQIMAEWEAEEASASV